MDVIQTYARILNICIYLVSLLGVFLVFNCFCDQNQDFYRFSEIMEKIQNTKKKMRKKVENLFNH